MVRDRRGITMEGRRKEEEPGEEEESEKSEEATPTWASFNRTSKEINFRDDWKRDKEGAGREAIAGPGRGGGASPGGGAAGQDDSGSGQGADSWTKTPFKRREKRTFD